MADSTIGDRCFGVRDEAPVVPARVDRVRVSYPSDLSQWGRSTVEGEPFRAYLRRVHDSAAPGDLWSEFVGVGCCGDSLDVPLRVEAVDGETDESAARSIGDDTEFDFEERAACEVAGGWLVQSDGAP